MDTKKTPHFPPVDRPVEEQMNLPPMDSARYPVIDGHGRNDANSRVTDQDGGLVRKLVQKLLNLCGGHQLADPRTRRLRQ